MTTTAKKIKKNTFLFVTGMIAALAGLLFGMDTGVIAGAVPLIKSDWAISNPNTIGWIVSIQLAGAVFGTILSGPVSRLYGRRFSIIISAILFTVCSIFSAFAQSIDSLIFVRFFLGIALGVASYITPLYIAEIATKEKRGGMIATYQLMITIGLLLSFVSDTFIAHYFSSWRMMLGIVAIPAFLMLLFLHKLPKSPRWLMLKDRQAEAQDVLSKILNSASEAESELITIKKTLSQKKHKVNFKLFFLVVLLGLGLQAIQQWTGINVIMYYAPSVFKAAGFATLNEQLLCTIAVGVVNVLTTLIAIKYVDRWGRKPILYAGLAIMTIACVCIGFSMQSSSHSSFSNMLALISVLVYIFGFAVSLGPIVWIICAEIFPLAYREVGIIITTAGNWTFNYMLTKAFPSLVHVYGTYNIFWGFAVMCIIGLFFVRFVTPETKGVSLEEIEKNLLSGKKLNKIGQ